MPACYASHLEALPGIVRPTLRDAALRILAAHGRNISSEPYRVRYAGVAGFKVVYFTSEPGVIARRGRGHWSTSSGPTADLLQHLIESMQARTYWEWAGAAMARSCTTGFIRGP